MQYKLRIGDMPAEERPSNRLISSGASSLSNAELLSIILRSGSVAENAINLSQRVLSSQQFPFCSYRDFLLSHFDLKFNHKISELKNF